MMSSQLRSGKLCLKKGQLCEALASFKRAFEAEPDARSSYYYGSTLVLSTVIDVARGIEILEKSIDKCKSKRLSDTHYAIGYGYLRLDQPGAAQKPLTEALRLYRAGGRRYEAECAKVLARLAESSLSRDIAGAAGYIAEALVILRKSNAVSTVRVRAQFVSAKIARLQGHADEATAAANKALEMAEGMGKARDAVLTAEIKEFIKPKGYSLVVPASVMAVVISVVAISGTMLLM